MAQTNEPSMEEILSSIKRIIAEDTDVSPAPTPRRARPEPLDEPDVLELTHPVGEPEMMDSPEPEPEPEDHSEPMSISAEEAPALATAPVAPPAATAVRADDESAILSTATADASRLALASLSRMVVRPEDAAADNTLEALVRDLLRPMLKDWLDANLPGIVQATVDREVARISGR